MESSEFPVADRVGYLVKQLQHALRARMDDDLERLGLTTAQYALLSAIEAFPGSSGADLARRCFITPQSVNGLMGALEREGLIARTASATHGRILETVLTAAGQARLARAHGLVIGIERSMLEALSDAQRHELARMLRQCIAGLTTQAA
jgi:DNA-binding MarR family transcriptional regulator